MSRQQARRTVRLTLLYPLLAALLLAMVGGIDVLHAQDDPKPDKPDAEPKKSLTETLGGEERYLTHLTTDKPIYREGETVYVRGTILHAFTQTPIDDHKDEIKALNDQIQAINSKRAISEDDRKKIGELNQRRWKLQQQTRLNPMVEIKDPKGATVVSSRTNVNDSTLGFKWEVPEGQAGGEYTIKVSYPWSGLAPAERTFDIRAYRAPRIKTQIQFLKDGYGPGDNVVATVEATRAEGGIPEGAKVTAIARVDGEEVARVATMVRETGVAEARFELPGKIERGEGSLTFVIEDGGVVESASKTLPILLQTVDLQLFPEGGDLVAGVENRVYFEAKTPFGKPADIKGKLMVIDGKVHGTDLALLKPTGVTYETTHEGRGVFTFKPEAGKTYQLLVTEPSSVTQTFELPEVAADKLALSTGSGIIAADEHLPVRIGGLSLDGINAGKVEVRHRERLLATETFRMLSGIKAAKPGDTNGDTAEFTIPLLADAAGILTVTAFDEQGKPLAERLVYRAPKNRVNIEIMPDSAQYTPGGQVQLTIKTTDSEGNPVAAVAGVTVTDDAVLEMIDTREQAPSLPAMVFLEQEVKDLADAQVYLDPKNEDAAEQLDLLLGTQGWRRFALVKLSDFIIDHGDDARRLFAFRKPVQHELRKAAAQRGAVRGGALFDDADFEGAAVPEAALALFGAPEDAADDFQNGAPDPQAEPEPLAVPNFDNAPGFDLNEALPNQQREQQDEAKIAEALEEAAEAEIAADGLFAADEPINARRMPAMVFIREYAHKQPAGKPFGQRSDFTETVYWSSTTKTDDKGLATVTFDLSDSVTSFRVKADAFTAKGALGEGTQLIESVRPFYVEPKLPLELTAGDKVLLPIAMVNNTDRELPVQLILSKLGRADDDTLDKIELGAETRGRAIHELVIGKTFGELAFNIEARAGKLFDQNNRKLRVVPKGFPIDDGSGGMLQPDGEASDEITIPESIVPGSLGATVTVYPTPMANLTEALEALIRDPYGCFEQTSSTTFPLVMAQQYFMTHQGIDPQLIAKAKEKLDKGYQRLIGFETEKKGYEWFGSTPPHEALTAYGLLQFNEMKSVMDVDQEMIDRTAGWLMSRCGNNGSFELDKKALDSFGRAPQDTTDAYIVWSMLEAGYDPEKIKKSIDLVLKNATEGKDAYIVALGANIAQLTQRDEAKSLLDKLAGMLTDEGFVKGAVTSITNSGGDALKIETTSLTILAWLRDDAYTAQVEQAILWLTERCKAGRFGSTQSTVLALKAIVEYDKARSTPKAPGSLVLTVDGKPVGEPVKFDEETKGAIHLPELASHLTPGKHTIAVQMTGGSKMPYSIAVDYFADTPASSDECKLRIRTKIPGPTRRGDPWKSYPDPITEGETTEVRVQVTNVTKDGLPTPLAIVGLPGGLEPDYDQLKELVAVGKIAAFEVIGRDVVLYWREMKPEQSIDLSIRCTAAVPGTYTGPASRAYLYYTDEHKQWTDGLTVDITPRAAE